MNNQDNEGMDCVLTLSNGNKERVRIIPHRSPISPRQLERDLIVDLNRMLVNTTNKVVKCHLMRN